MPVRDLLVSLLLAVNAAAATPSLIFVPTERIFTPQAVGAPGPSKNMTIMLSQTGSLQVTGTTTTPGFTAPNSCGGDLGPGIQCPIPVTFTPQFTGPVQGTISVSYTSSAAASQSASLCGTGLPGPGDFTVGLVFDCFAKTTGTTPTFNLGVYPNAFNGMVNLSCTTAPSFAPCTVSPATVTLSGSTAVNITVTTGSPTASARPPLRAPRRALGMLALAMVMFFAIGRGSRKRAMVCLALMAMVAALFAGCGSGSPKVPQITSVTITAAGSNSVTHQSSLNLSAP